MVSCPRVAIMGTAPSWRLVPWDDPGLKIWSLNDAYVLKPKRIDAWFDLHPLDKLYFRPRGRHVIDLADVPHGHYVRPEGHVDWLKTQAAQIPVYLQTVPEGWPANATEFPIAIAREYLYDYVASGPVMMIALAMQHGCRELHIYGIHLSTEGEYLEQRPNFEHLLGRFLGPEAVTLTRTNGLRRYTSRAGRVLVLPESSPILQHNRIYGYEPKPAPPEGYRALKARLHALQGEHTALIAAFVARPWYRPMRHALQRLTRVEAELSDVREQIVRIKQQNSSKVQTLPVVAA
jgi:hypothetical protein